MNGRRSTGVAVAIMSAGLLATMVPAGEVSAAPAAAGGSQAVIVLMRAQHPDLKPKTQALQRQQAVGADQAGIVADLRDHDATHIQQLDTVSAVAASASPAEIARLRSDAQVTAVVPDRVIPRPTAQSTAAPQRPGADSRSCPADPGKPLLEPEALSLTDTESTDPHAQQAHSIATGKGVKIAFMAEGIDVNNPDFIRPDGSHVFFDYQDFSGDGTQDDSGGGEAFGDASALAAQGNQVYDLSKALPYAGLAGGCAFRIRGFAPDASLAAIKVFGQFGSTESALVRGIDYAVNHDKVDVLSESFGGYPFPDGAVDPIAMADEAAIAAGVTVVAGTGDSGQSGTVGSPASAPDVVTVGGTTAYRLNATQKGYAGWVSDNVAALSSGGPTLDDKYVDLVAPGMTGMAVCTVNPALWDSCARSTEVFGGTSQATPFVAGASALVIQAYADSHQGARPSPALVRRLLTGTATDLDTPSDQQGAGLLNSYAAVRAARAVGTTSNSGTALIPSATQLDLTGAAGSVRHVSETVTNTARLPQTVTASSRALGAGTFSATRVEQVGGTAQAATGGGPGENPTAAPAFGFTVPAGTRFVEAQMAWPGTSTSGPLNFELFDPRGRLVQESYDYGPTDYQYAGVHDPTPGRWTEKILWGDGRDHFEEPVATPGSYRGQVSLRVDGSRYADAGVPRVTRTIPAGGSATFDLSVPMPGQAGDAPASIQFDSDTGTHLSVPLGRRVLIPTASGSSFTANVTGGVGRLINQYLGYYLDVPRGRHDMTVGLTMPDPATQLTFFLVSPDGQILSGDTNATETAWGSGQAKPTGTASMTVDEPVSGRWQVIVLLSGPSSGTDFGERVTGTVRFDTVRARTVGLPTSPTAKIAPGSPATGSVVVTNTGAAGAYFFLDPRLDGPEDVVLPPVAGQATIDLPEDVASTSPPTYLVPPHTSGLAQTIHASLPVGAYLEYGEGNPGAYGTTGAGNSTVDTITADQLAIGNWITDVGELGPFAGPAPAGTANISLTAHTQPFDSGATSSTGDHWSTSVGGSAGHAVYLPAGATATIAMTLKPTAAPGTVVHGTVYVDTWNNEAGQGSELTGLPYSYTTG
jgi:Subtilase family